MSIEGKKLSLDNLKVKNFQRFFVYKKGFTYIKEKKSITTLELTVYIL